LMALTGDSSSSGRMPVAMTAMVALVAYNREDLMIAALAALMVAGVIVALGAIVLLIGYRRRRTRDEAARSRPDWVAPDWADRD
jgi:hypothetical protein